MADRLLTPALKPLETLCHENGPVIKAFILGRTRTYFRAGALEQLEAERLKRLGVWAVEIQRIVREFVGHAVGTSMHEKPEIPNYGRRGSGALLKPGMTLAIEPMINLGGPKIKMLDDGWTAVTRDGKNSAHFEHTVLVTGAEPEILTIPKK